MGEHWLRCSIGQVFNAYVRLLVLPGITDTQCELKMFDVEAAELLFPYLTIDGIAFDVELLVMARCAGYEILEVGILWHGRAESRMTASGDTVAFGGVLRIRKIPGRVETGNRRAEAQDFGSSSCLSPSRRGIPRSSSSSPSSIAAAPSPRSGRAASTPSEAPTRD